MKRAVLIAVFLIFAFALQAQKDTLFRKHELRASVGDALLFSIFFPKNVYPVNVSVSYFYRPVKWFWVGGNFLNYFGRSIPYQWREYYVNGNYQDFSKSKMAYSGVIAPEIRFSYLNRKSIILYSAFSAGIGFENGYDNKLQKYSRRFSYLHFTCFGFSYGFEQNERIFMGGEFGIGYKGFLEIHAGYRF